MKLIQKTFPGISYSLIIIVLLTAVHGCSTKGQNSISLSCKSRAIREEPGALDHRDYVPPGSNAAYGTNEVGWTQAWVPAVLAIRELNKNLWYIT
jgi:hypothetical protein